MAESKTKRIILGSGHLYVMEFTGTIPETDTICVEDNRFSFIKNGATLTYTPEYYEAKDDLGYVTKTVLTSEEVVLKTGLMTLNANTLNKLSATGRVTEDSSKKRRTIKIGGLANDQKKRWLVCFHHPDPIDGDIWVIIVGKNTAGFEMAFAKDSETVVNAEFKAEAQDDEGTLVQYTEADSTIAGA